MRNVTSVVGGVVSEGDFIVMAVEVYCRERLIPTVHPAQAINSMLVLPSYLEHNRGVTLYALLRWQIGTTTLPTTNNRTIL